VNRQTHRQTDIHVHYNTPLPYRARTRHRRPCSKQRMRRWTHRNIEYRACDWRGSGTGSVLCLPNLKSRLNYMPLKSADRNARRDEDKMKNKVSPRRRRDDMLPADGSSTVAYRIGADRKSRRICVRPRTGPQPAHLWWPAVAELRAASVPLAQAAAPRDRHTDGSRYSKMPPPLGRGHDDKEVTKHRMSRCRLTLRG